MDLATEHALKLFADAALIMRRRKIQVRFAPDEDCRFIRIHNSVYNGGHFTTDPGQIWAWDEHMAGRSQDTN